MTAATTNAASVRIPDSPTHHVASGVGAVAGSNAVWMMLFQAPCDRIAGQMLPVSRRNQAIT
jgi:hypothetical protein